MTSFYLRTARDQPLPADADAFVLDWFGGAQRQRSTVSATSALFFGLAPAGAARDLFRLGGAVYCVDKVARRDRTADAWTRELELDAPVATRSRWQTARPAMTEALTFLSGDHWKLRFRTGGEDVRGETRVRAPDAVCLFSGGLDSLAGAIDLLEEGRDVLLVGHFESGFIGGVQETLARQLQRTYGDRVRLRQLKLGPAKPNRLQARPLPSEKERETTTRARSFLFIAAGLAVASAFGEEVPLYVPENGFIGINVPFVASRAGSLSTRTTHPYFVERVEEALDALGIGNEIINPFRLKTKGEALADCRNPKLLAALGDESISCAHPESARWDKLPPSNCGYCLPCLIRRVALHGIGLDAGASYRHDSLVEPALLEDDSDRGADLRALVRGIARDPRPNDVLRNGAVPAGRRGGLLRRLPPRPRRVRGLAARRRRPGVARCARCRRIRGLSLFVDSHCHIDRFADVPAVLAAAERAGVVTVAVTELPSRFQMLQTQLRGRDRVRVALGFHPLAVPRDLAYELALFRRLLERTDYVGEVGLDRSQQGQGSSQRQHDVFERILALPDIRKKVLTVHSRRAEKETIELLKAAGVTAILHWYSGPLGQIEHALEAGLYFSVNPAMVLSKNGRRILDALPRERVVTETDAPYTKVGGRPSEPRDVPTVVAELARIWRISADEARDSIFATMSKIHRTATTPRAETI